MKGIPASFTRHIFADQRASMPIHPPHYRDHSFGTARHDDQLTPKDRVQLMLSRKTPNAVKQAVCADYRICAVVQVLTRLQWAHL
jgi:hypothetical protein